MTPADTCRTLFCDLCSVYVCRGRCVLPSAHCTLLVALCHRHFESCFPFFRGTSGWMTSTQQAVPPNLQKLQSRLRRLKSRDVLEPPYTVGGGGGGTPPGPPSPPLPPLPMFEADCQNFRPAFGGDHRGTLGGGRSPPNPPPPPSDPPPSPTSNAFLLTAHLFGDKVTQSSSRAS